MPRPFEQQIYKMSLYLSHIIRLVLVLNDVSHVSHNIITALNNIGLVRNTLKAISNESIVNHSPKPSNLIQMYNPPKATYIYRQWFPLDSFQAGPANVFIVFAHSTETKQQLTQVLNKQKLSTIYKQNSSQCMCSLYLLIWYLFTTVFHSDEPSISRLLMGSKKYTFSFCGSMIVSTQ